ncbi:MAG: translocation/assembly module TamB domain-containing protein [Proteobacteria bacterium]|nr:translocation/assembly module TamB domain-containing protein [Pseudomonadota bacterium]
MSARRIILVLAILLVGILLVGPPLLVWSALYTTGGLQFVVRHIPHKIGSVRLSIEGVSGIAAQGVAVQRVQIDHDMVHISIEGVSARLVPGPLLLQTIRVQEAAVRNVDVQVKRRTHPPNPGAPQFLPRWLLISVEDLRAAHASLAVYSGFHLRADRLQAAAVIRHRSIRLFQADALLDESAHAMAIGTLRATDPFGVDVKLILDWQPQGQPPWRLAGSARGDLDTLHIVAHTQDPFRADAAGQLRELTGHWNWLGSITVRQFSLRPWGAADVLGDISGHLTAHGDAAGFGAQGSLTPAGLHAGPFDLQFAGNYAAEVLSAQRVQLRHPGSGLQADVTGSVAIVPHGPALDLQGQWRNFRWPLTGREPAVRSEAGSFRMSGTLPYAVQVDAKASAAGLPTMPLQARGTLDKDNVSFDPAEIDLLGGHASLRGRVTWAPRDTWSIAGRVTGIDPAKLRPDLPGSVSFLLDASGTGFDPRGQLTASFSNLSGRVRGAAASGSGSIGHAGDTWSFDRLRVSLGTANLALDGRINQQLDLRFALDTRDLSLLSPGAAGVLRASGTLGGTAADPTVSGSAHGSGIDLQGIHISSLAVEADFDPRAQDHRSRIDARASHLTYLGRTIDNMAFTLGGLPQAYDMHFAARATGLAVKAQASGPYSHGQFRGWLTALSLDGDDPTLHLELEQPAELLASADHVRLERTCLTGRPGGMCAEGDWTAAAWSGNLETHDLPLHTLTAGLTNAVEYRGTISARAAVAGGAATPVTGTLRAELVQAEILHKLASKHVERTRIGSGLVTATATPTTLTAQADLGDGQVGTLRASLTAQRSTARWQDMPVSGELHAQTDETGLISLYAPDIDRASGHLSADVQVAGTVGAPRLSGNVRLADGQIDVYQTNLALRQIAFEATFGDNGVDFKGGARTGGGSVQANGHVEWRDLQPYGKFHLQGSNLRVADIPEAQIDASPDLDFTIKGHRIDIDGKVLVPNAKITSIDITNAVRTSSDEQIVGAESDDPSKRFEVVSSIGLAIGDNVHVESLGLSAKLAGGLLIQSGADAITRGTGEVDIESGKYSAYARQLDIDEGHLYFNGGPIDNPGIMVRAKKVFPDVTAFLLVRGTLAQPQMSFSSSPPLPQSQIVSLILAGGSLESTQAHGANVALGQGVAMLAQQYGGALGIQDAGLESDINNETSVVFGRYLSPRLYVSYGISLTQQLNTFKLRYTLGDHWTVKAEVGQVQGADLVYTITK